MFVCESESMKITDIKVTPSLGAEHRHWSLLKIFTDEGIVGLGEWTAGGPIEQLKQMLIGRDPTNINRLHYDHLWQMQGRGAGVEIALWDIRGKQLNAPMHELLGGKLRDRIRVYCDCHSGAHWTREDYERRWQETRASGQLDPVYETSAYVSMAKEVVAEGYTAIKFDLDVPNPWKLDAYDRSISRRQHHHIVTTIESLRQSNRPLHRLIHRFARFLQPGRRSAHLQRRGAPRPALVGGSHPLGVGQCRRIGQDLPAD